MYIYIYIYMCMYVYIYIYIYIYTCICVLVADKWGQHLWGRCKSDSFSRIRDIRADPMFPFPNAGAGEDDGVLRLSNAQRGNGTGGKGS